MADELLKEEFDNLPSQDPVSPDDEVVSSGSQAQFNPSGKIEDIFENTEKPDNAGGQAGFKVGPSSGQGRTQEMEREPQPQSQSQLQPAVSKPPPASLPTFSQSTPGVSRPQPASLTQEPEFDDEPVSSKRKYFIIGIIGIVVVAGSLAYWFFIRDAGPEAVVDQNGQEVQEDVNFEDFDTPAVQTPPVAEPENGDVTDNPEPNDTANQINIFDSDQDGLSDEEESGLGTDPLKADSDNDGLFDREEVKVYLTDPTNADTDNDGYLDGEEIVNGFNPKGTGSFLPPIQ